MRLKIYLLSALAMMLPLLASAQLMGGLSKASAPEPVKWSAHVEQGKNKGEVTVVISADITDGWHLYGMSLPDDGPKATVFSFDGSKDAVPAGAVKPTRKPVTADDPLFGMPLSWWEAPVDFRIPVKVLGKDASLQCTVSFMTCNGSTCMPPRKETMNIPINTNHH